MTKRALLLAVVVGGAASAPTPSPTPAPTVFTCSQLTCDELGFPSAATFGDITVCGETDAPSLGGACSGARSWSEASAFCLSAGARLCSAAELENDEARNSGCNYNTEMIWSSTECDGGYKVAHGGSGFGTVADTCQSTEASDVYVRCCADAYGCTPFPVFEPTPVPTVTAPPTSVATCSESTCANLGWVNAPFYGSTSICGETDLGLGGCSGHVAWEDAKTKCQSVGARLCSADELQNNEAAKSGCNYDSALVWSADSCGTGMYTATYGSSFTLSGTSCVAMEDAATVSARCCADTDACTQEPSPVPTKVPTSSPTFSPSTTPRPSQTYGPTSPSAVPTTETPHPTQPSPVPTVTVDCSIENCDTLGWDYLAYGSSEVCGETDAFELGGACSGMLTWDEARVFCQAGGARMCTVDELLADEPRGTGCNYNEQRIWSSTPCGTSRPYKVNTFFTAWGSSTSGSDTECQEHSLESVAVARCCADVQGCTDRPSPEPTYVGETPAPSHTVRPSWEPTPVPTHFPTHVPTESANHSMPTFNPTQLPTSQPTHAPSREPTPLPTISPTAHPTHVPTSRPTETPTSSPTHMPSPPPTKSPTPEPTPPPTRTPTLYPTRSSVPSEIPTPAPSRWPTPAPTPRPSWAPTGHPTVPPTPNPSPTPTHVPTDTDWPTHVPTILPTPEPSVVPSPKPTAVPSPEPTHVPTLFPTKRSLCSDKTCVDLGWEAATWGHPEVCGASLSATNGTCSGSLGFEAARTFCQSQGARLCEAYELARDDARDTGCKYNGELVWSGTPCQNNQRSYYVLYGSSDGDRLHGARPGTYGRTCEVAIGEGALDFPVRCCADTDTAACSPSETPTHIPTPLPTTVPTLAPTSSNPTPIPTPAPTALDLTCQSPAALYEGMVGQSLGTDYTCSQVEVGEVDEGLAQKFCNFAPGECAPSDLWETCTFNVRSSSLTIHAPPSYKFQAPPSILFCTKQCTECMAK